MLGDWKLTRGKKKKCFVISPIGKEGSDVRKWADEVLKLIIEPAAKDYEVTRSDMIGIPGMITTQIIERLVKADLVVADLSRLNPNVFYELAVRHFTGKPVIQIIGKEDRIPFDVGDVRTLFYDRKTPSSLVECGEKMKEFIKVIETGIQEPNNPITEAIGILELSESEHPLEKVSTRLMSLLQEIHSMVASLPRTSVPLISTDWITPSYDFTGYLQGPAMYCAKCNEIKVTTLTYTRTRHTPEDPLITIQLCTDCAAKMRESGEIV